MGHSNHNNVTESAKHTSSQKGFQSSFKAGNGDFWADSATKSVWHPNWQPNWTQPALSFSAISEKEPTKTLGQNTWSSEPATVQALWSQHANQINTWNTTGTRFSPAICIAEDAKCFYVSCELPGVNERELNVIWHEGTLVIRGQKRQFKFDSDCEVYATDQMWGHFHREIPMSHVAACVDSAKITTKFYDGILEVTLPKMTEGNTSFIKVTSKK